jgi:hypothetical protein
MGHPTYVRDANATGETHISDVGFTAPCLSRALLKATPNQYDCYKTKLILGIEANPTEDPQKPIKISLGNAETFGAELTALLQHIYDRLELGLDEAWMSEYGYLNGGDADKLKEHLKKQKAGETKSIFDDESVGNMAYYLFQKEEQWARAFTELMIFAAYAGTDKLYKNTGNITALYDEFPRVFPIAMACQDLSSYCILSRGFPTSSMGVGLACSAGSADQACFEKGADKVKKSPPLDLVAVKDPVKKLRQKAAPEFASTEKLAAMGCGPGSVVVFNPGGSLYPSQDLGPYTHIGSVLRVAGQAIQFIDTGVLAGNEADESAAEGGTADHGFRRGQIMAAASCVAAAALQPAPKDLVAQAQAMKKSLPLGFVRLVVVDVGSSPVAVRYVSKLLPMMYPLARFIWALRGLPIRDNLRVLVQVYTTVHKASSDQHIKDPTTRPDDLFAKRDQSSLWESHILRGEPSGKVVVGRHKEEPGVGKNGWVDDFRVANPLPADPSAAHLQATKMVAPEFGSIRVWSRKSSTLKVSYLAKPGDKTATVGENPTNVAFFDG